ncbi:MAG: Ig-like domain-containing protein [Deltaproteobacteria bacterium]|nr:Ig-like domain-containing protein [Deltaproteobacteria bacterium]
MRSRSFVVAIALVAMVAAAACGGGSTHVQEDAGPPDETAPVVTLDLGRYDVVAGARVVTMFATDDRAVVRTELLVDGVAVAESTQEPFTIDWDSTAAADGVRSLQVAAYDAAGNRGESEVVPVFVVNAGQEPILDEDPDQTAGFFAATFSVPANWGGSNEQIDRKYHWTMPAGIGRVVTVLLFDPTVGFELNYSTGTGWCPDSGQAMVELSENDGEILLEFAPGVALPEGQWFIHVGGSNAADMKGQTAAFRVRVVLLP